jgi:hypothetical protein
MSSFIKKVSKAAFGVGGLLLGKLLKKPKPPKSLPTVTRDQAKENFLANDRYGQRKGFAANILSGSGGAESSQGTKKLLLGT